MRAISSHTMSYICEKRNPRGKEENWLKNESYFREFPSNGRLFAAVVGFLLNAVAATIESVASAVFMALCLPTVIFSRRPLQLSEEWLSSSAFTLGWSLANLFYNFVFPNLLTRENHARDFAFRGGVTSPR